MKKLYLVRHGQALPEEIDPKQSLSSEGKAEVRATAETLKKRYAFPIGRIIHSGKARARQTAEIMAQVLAPKAILEEHSHLKPSDSIEPMTQELNGLDSEWMIVSHLPYLNLLLSHLLTGSDHYAMVHFQPGTVVCLKLVDRHWIVEWISG